MKNYTHLLILCLLISLGISQTTKYPELIKNGSFAKDGANWTLWNWTDPQGHSANVTASYKDGNALLDFSKHIDYPTFEYWAVTWSTGPVTLERRQWYRLQFEAWGSDSSGFNIAILGPWDAVKLTQNFYLSRRSPTITKTKQRFIYEFRHSYSGLNNDGRISIQMARSPAESLYFDNFSLQGIDEDSIASALDNHFKKSKVLEPVLAIHPEKKYADLHFNSQNRPQRVNAFSLSGRLLRTWDIPENTRSQIHSINIQGLPLGMVLFTLVNEKVVYSQKLLITP